MALEFSAETMKRFEGLLALYPVREAALVPVLTMAQEEFGTLSSEAIAYVSSLMELPRARVYGVATFYSMLRLQPVGKFHLQVCRTISCSLMGAERIVRHLQKRLGIKPGETTADGKFTLSEVECLASCGTAPAMQVGDDYHENLTEEKIDRLLSEMR
jgi:NADH-quinone oxidoreductase E subunit